MSLSLHIASRYLLSPKSHSAVNIIAIVSTCGVAVAVAALVCVLSVFNGFSQLITGRLSLLDPEVAVVPMSGKTVADGDSLATALTALPQVELARPVVEDQALAVFADFQMPVRLRGVTDDYDRLNAMDSIMVDGEFVLHDGVSSFAVVGVGPALQLMVRPGSPRMLRLYAPQRVGRVNLANPMGAFRADSLFCAGIFQLQQNDYDADLIFVPIDVARRLYDYDREASRIEVRLMPGVDEPSARAAIARVAGPQCEVKNRLMLQAAAYRMVNVEKWVTFLLLAFILIIATFNVIGTLSLLVIEKRSSIDTLRWMGADEGLVTRVFVAVSWLIALVGAAVGIVLGLALCLGQQRWGWLTIAGDPSNQIVHAYPVAVQAGDLLVVLGLVAVVAALTGLVVALIVRHR